MDVALRFVRWAQQYTKAVAAGIPLVLAGAEEILADGAIDSDEKKYLASLALSVVLVILAPKNKEPEVLFEP
jgi:hypothetical protein